MVFPRIQSFSRSGISCGSGTVLLCFEPSSPHWAKGRLFYKSIFPNCGGRQRGRKYCRLPGYSLQGKGEAPILHKQLLYYPVTNACFDTPSYRRFACGYYLYRAGMQWFWKQYCPHERDRRRTSASPLRASLQRSRKGSRML